MKSKKKIKGVKHNSNSMSGKYHIYYYLHTKSHLNIGNGNQIAHTYQKCG